MPDDRLHPTDRQLAVEVETGTGALRLDLARRLAAEALGTGLLIVAVIGSGIMATRLSPDEIGLQLLENAIATAGALVGLILMFGAVSGAHFNPIVTLTDRLLGTTTNRDTGLYVVAQVIGGCLGAMLVNLMFELPAVELSTKDRSSPALWLSEVVATVDAAARDPGLRAHRPRERRAVRGGGLDRRGLLVHLVDQLRQPGRHHRPHPVGHLRRHRPRLGADVHRHAARRGGDRLRADPLLLPPRPRRLGGPR